MTDASTLSAREIARLRLRAQCIATPKKSAECESPLALVTHLGAMQAQEYASVLWSIGLRVPGSTKASIEAAFAGRKIVRTWPMRGTLHVIPAADARWMLELLTPRVFKRTARRREQLELDERVLQAAARVFTEALRGGNRLTREEMMALLEGAGIATAGQRGYHILFDLSMRRLLVFGPSQGAQQTFVLFDEWLPDATSLPLSEALALIVNRYFTSHGPATLKDFAGWSGLTIADAKAGLADNAHTLTSITQGKATYWMSCNEAARASESLGSNAQDPDVHLLPGFDEFVLGYKDRSAILHPEHSDRIAPGGNGVFKPTVVIDHQVTGVWKRVAKGGTVSVETTPFATFTAAQKRGIERASRRYLAFVGSQES